MGAYLGRNYVGVGSGNIGYVGASSRMRRAGARAPTRARSSAAIMPATWRAISGTPSPSSPSSRATCTLSGLVERDWNEDTGLYNSYFKRNDIVGKDSAIKPHPNGYVRAWGDWLGLNYSGGEHGPSAQGFSYGPIVDDAKYADRLFWEGEGYDFEGDEVRLSTIDNQIPGHVNK